MEAEGYLRRYLERVPDSAPGHLALASLYDETLGNPTSALYHYEEYLRLVPEDAADRATVEHYRQLVRAKLLKELSGEPLPVVPAAVLAAENRQLRRTNDQLKRYIQNQNRRIAELLNGAPASVPSPSVSSRPPHLHRASGGYAGQNRAAVLRNRLEIPEDHGSEPPDRQRKSARRPAADHPGITVRNLMPHTPCAAGLGGGASPLSSSSAACHS